MTFKIITNICFLFVVCYNFTFCEQEIINEIFLEKTNINFSDKSDIGEHITDYLDSKECYIISNENKNESEEKFKKEGRLKISPSGAFILKLPLYDKLKKKYNSIIELTKHSKGIIIAVNEFDSSRKHSKTTIISLNWEGDISFQFDLNSARTHVYISTLDEYFITYSVSILHSNRPNVIIEKRSIINGILRWKLVLNGSSRSKRTFYLRPALDKNRNIIIIPHEGNKLSAYNLDTSINPIWTFTAKSTILCSPVIDQNNKVYTCLNGKHLISLNEMGQKDWEYKPINVLNINNLIHLSLFNKYLVFRDINELSFFDTNSKKRIWDWKKEIIEMGSVISKNRIWTVTKGQISNFSFSGEKKIVSKKTIYSSFLPLILEKSSIVILSVMGVDHISFKGDMIHSYHTQNIFPKNKSPLVVYNGFAIYIANHRVSGETGIYKVDLKLPKISKKGWPQIDGNLRRTRKHSE